MMSKKQILAAIVSLVSINDLELVPLLARDRDRVVDGSQEGLIVEIARQVKGILFNYDYTRSAEFLRRTADKSTTRTVLMVKLEADPVKRKARLQQGECALSELLDHENAFNLFPPQSGEVLERIRRLASELYNPD